MLLHDITSVAVAAYQSGRADEHGDRRENCESGLPLAGENTKGWLLGPAESAL